MLENSYTTSLCVSKQQFFRAVDIAMMSGYCLPSLLIDRMGVSETEADTLTQEMVRFGIIQKTNLFDGYSVAMTRMQVQELLDSSPQAEYYENLSPLEMDDSDWNNASERMPD